MKVLAGFICNGKKGGIDKYLLNFLKNVEGRNVQIDFITSEKTDSLQKELKKFGSHLYEVPTLKHPIRQYLSIKEILISGNYDMSYLNISTALNCVAAIASWRAGIKKRAIHSHSSGNDCNSVFKRKMLDFFHIVCKQFLYLFANKFYACSMKAAVWMFPKRLINTGKVDIIYNAVDINAFRYKPDLRIQVRESLGIDKELVLGHVGNFCYAKNYPFLIEVFKTLADLTPEIKLLLVGNGAMYGEIKEKIKKYNLQDRVLFLGWRQDISNLYQAMDIFLLPSNFEGLPIVGVEAQSVGLKCLFSDKITKEVNLTREAEFLPINSKDAAKIWVEHILKGKNYHRENNVIIQNKELYDLEEQKIAYLKILE